MAARRHAQRPEQHSLRTTATLTAPDPVPRSKSAAQHHSARRVPSARRALSSLALRALSPLGSQLAQSPHKPS